MWCFQALVWQNDSREWRLFQQKACMKWSRRLTFSASSCYVNMVIQLQAIVVPIFLLLSLQLNDPFTIWLLIKATFQMNNCLS